MKTIKSRVEELETGVGPKPILVLWGDQENPDVCRVDDAGDALPWDDAEKRFGKNNILIRVKFVDGRST